MGKNIQIYDYMNYREFLRDTFCEKKIEHPFYSYRLFSQKAGFKSPNFLKLVIDGDRNLTKESIFRVSKAFSLNKKDSEYFENLVFLNQCKSLEEKALYLSKVYKYHNSSNSRLMKDSEYDYYSKWYNVVIRELVTSVDFKGDFARLASYVVPPISALEAEKSVELLLRLQFIEAKKDGIYKANALSLTTGNQVKSAAVTIYHKEMMRLAAESIERIPRADRDISSVTINLSDENYRIAIEKIQAMRKEIMELSSQENKRGMVAQLNLQIFPVSLRFTDKAIQK
jgi:uncharacterized protein (TIGR02147 family)